MTSITILAALLLISWTFTILLILILAFAIFFLKDSYTFKVHLERVPTPLTTTPIDKQALNWANNGTQLPPSPPSPSPSLTSTPTFSSSPFWASS
ncbi:uncharacterized protein FIBRA_09131 [Fibroporia radiculosa]|uniref:Uncharacterized protein n=1 Tax=Fibroporia radiculosa TaxID=599839 RepID=J4GIY8_9APHY|nr:uncharacterized protein FIBRA_09131 [Fibroporia radiculosa]CCM06828.1 predicted protein [Fibroporia radiculosa]